MILSRLNVIMILGVVSKHTWGDNRVVIPAIDSSRILIIPAAILALDMCSSQLAHLEPFPSLICQQEKVCGEFGAMVALAGGGMNIMLNKFVSCDRCLVFMTEIPNLTNMSAWPVC
jgi:hypothetical protein